MPIEPYVVDVPQSVLDDLHQRLARTRWPAALPDAGWSLGTDQAYLRVLVSSWQHTFDWRVQERRINQLPHFRAQLNGLNIHFVHQRGQGPRPLPLLLTHGWPDSFYRMHKLIPLLTDPGRHGADPADAFDVVVPSLPGFGFSDPPLSRDFTVSMVADLFAQLMSELGYDRYGAHAGDLGRSVTEALARHYPQRLAGIHLTDVWFGALLQEPSEDLSADERAYLAAGRHWQQTEGSYAHQQSTRPQTLAFGLNDSPAGLAAWLVEKFRAWSDCDGDVERRFSRDELLTHITLYWVTQTIGSSFLPYAEWQRHLGREALKRIEVPTGVALFPADLVRPPRSYAERRYDLRRWTEMPAGGHFAALEEPHRLAEELRAFFRPLRP